MPIHHFTIVTKNYEAAHYFYSEVMGFPLCAAVKRLAPGGGWTKHIFYDIGGGETMAIWDLRGLEGVQIQPDEWRSGMSSGLGLPNWVNHVAFKCEDGEEELLVRQQRWLDHGYHVTKVDHEFIRSIYTFDPDGNWVEWTYNLRSTDEQDRLHAENVCLDDTVPTEEEYPGTVVRSTVPKHRPEARKIAKAASI